MVPSENGNLPEYREVTGTPPGSLMGLLGLSGKGGMAGQGGRAPLPPFPSPSRTRRRGRRPSLSLHLRKPSWTRIGGGGNPTPGGSRTPLGALLEAGRPPPLAPLYTGAGGT